MFFGYHIENLNLPVRQGAWTLATVKFEAFQIHVSLHSEHFTGERAEDSINRIKSSGNAISGWSTMVWSLSVWDHQEARGCFSYSTLSCLIQNCNLVQTQKLVFYVSNWWTSITSPKLKKASLWEQKLNLATFLLNRIREVLKSVPAFFSPPPSC